MGITLKQAKALQFGDILYSNKLQNANKSPQRWRVNGQVKTWKRDLDRLQIPLKFGLYQFGYLCNGEIGSDPYKNLYSVVFKLDELELTEETAKGN